jgi:hypothetical protein
MNHVTWRILLALAPLMLCFPLLLRSREVAARFCEPLTSATYPLGISGRKTITFSADHVELKVEHPGNFSERVPVVRNEGELFAADAGFANYDRLIFEV